MNLDLSLLDEGGTAPAAAAANEAAPARWLAPVAPLTAFEEDPENPRREEEDEDALGEFGLLLASVRQYGILQPVVVRPMADGKLRLRFGRRRYRAACVLQLPGLAYVVTEDGRQFDDYAQVAENQQRKPLQPLELAGFIERKLGQGQQKKQVAARLGIDASAVTHLLALAQDPPPWLLELYHGRRCRTPQYLYELRALAQLAPKLVLPAVATVELVDRGWLQQLAARVRAAQPSGQLSVAGEVKSTAAAPRRPQGAAATAASAIRRPGLYGCHAGRALMLLLDRKPDAPGMIWARYEGEQAAVALPIGEVRLTALEELAGRQPAAALPAGAGAATVAAD